MAHRALLTRQAAALALVATGLFAFVPAASGDGPRSWDGRWRYEASIEGAACGEPDFSFEGEVRVEKGRFRLERAVGPFHIKFSGRFEDDRLTVESTTSREWTLPGGGTRSASHATVGFDPIDPAGWSEVHFRTPRDPDCGDFANRLRLRPLDPLQR